MNLLTKFFHNIPLFSIFFLITGVIWAYWIYFPGVGKGSDAAGMGMSKGFAFLIFYFILFLYVLVLITSLVLFYTNSQATVTRAILNWILLVPLLLGGGMIIVYSIDFLTQSHALKESFQRWHSVAKTKTYVSPSGYFSFQYATHSKGTHNYSFIEKTALKESNNNIILVNQYFDNPSNTTFLGSIKVLSVASESAEVIPFLKSYFKKYTVEECGFVKSDKHPFSQFKDKFISVYTFESNQGSDDCMYHYSQHHKKVDPDFPGDRSLRYQNVYFVHNSKKPDKILEIIVSGQFLITGPLERNLSAKSSVDWYQTISLK